MHELRTWICALALLVATPALAEPLTVAVAPNVKFAFGALQAEFKKESGIDIRPVYAASGALTAQIVNGAPFDVFMSADMRFPEEVHKAGYAAAPPKIYAYGILVLWTAKDYDLSDWKTLLADKGVTRIALPNPKTAPYGAEAMKLLTHLKLDATLKTKLVYAEGINQATGYILSKAADIGFNAKSVAASKEMRGKGKWVEIREAPVEPIAQGVVILRHGQDNGGARKFYDFLFSPTARAIFAAHGYQLP